MTVNQRIKFLREQKSLTQDAFGKTVQISRATLSQIEIGKQQPTLEQLDRITHFFGVSYDWLINGRDYISQASVLMENPSEKDVVSQKKGIVGRKPIPLIPADAFAGFGDGEVSISEQDIKEEYVIPEFRDADFVIRIKGDSMYPKYSSGDVVACIKIRGRFYQWNKVHVIATKEQGVLIKRIQKGSSDESLLAVSDNKDYSPFEIPIDEITNIALVIGVIRME